MTSLLRREATPASTRTWASAFDTHHGYRLSHPLSEIIIEELTRSSKDRACAPEDGLVRQQPTADRTAIWIDINITDFLHARQLGAQEPSLSNAHRLDGCLWHVGVLRGPQDMK